MTRRTKKQLKLIKRAGLPFLGGVSPFSISSICVFLVMIFCFPAGEIIAETNKDIFNTLQTRLIKDGMDNRHIRALYQSPRVFFDTKSVALFFMHSEARLNYDQFTAKKTINKARKYLKKYADNLGAAQKKYGVNKEIITGIILVETRLGTYIGKSYVFSTLSTMAAISDPGVRDQLWESIPSARKISRNKFEQKAEKKSEWAYTELKALVRYAQKEGKDPTKILGSYAGAMGICQFMPSNIPKYAQDGNRDGHIDLFNHSDAIASVANYLKHHGWRPGISDERAIKVILRYNYSRYYAKTILKVAKLLKG